MITKDRIKEYLTNFKLVRSREELLAGGSVFLILFAVFWIILTSSPQSFDEPFSFEIEKGSTLNEIAFNLKDQNLIRSKTLFNSLIILKAGDSKVVSGEYLFNDAPNIFDLVKKVTTGDYGIITKGIRVPEGATVKEIGQLFEQEFRGFDKEVFYQLAEGKEGYLFPDTYFFLENVKTHEVLDKLEETFKDKLARLKSEVDLKESVEDIVIMASIIEKEATADSRLEVSSILWKRLGIGMALQVDATFVYSDGKGTFDLTKKDLANKDNPYNTYVHPGLPPTPISNPSFESLKAAAAPTSTPHIFFLTGHDGEMYYAETFEGHKRNRARHLN